MPERRRLRTYDFHLIAHEHLYVFRKPAEGENLKDFRYSVKWWLRDLTLPVAADSIVPPHRFLPSRASTCRTSDGANRLTAGVDVLLVRESL